MLLVRSCANTLFWRRSELFDAVIGYVNPAGTRIASLRAPEKSPRWRRARARPTSAKLSKLLAPAAWAAVIAALRRASATLNALSREISPPYTTSRFASSVDITVVQKPSPSRRALYPAYG